MKRIVLLLLMVATYGYVLAQVEITGKITQASDFAKARLFGVENNTELANADISATGEFKIQANITKPDYFKLSFSPMHTVFLVVSPNEKINITLDPNHLDSPSIKGSPESEKLYQINGQLSDFAAKEEELLGLYEKNKIDRKQFVIDQIIKSPSSLSNFFFLDFLDFTEDKEVVEKMVAAMYAKHPDNKFVQELHLHMKSEQEKSEATNNISAGKQAPEITLPNPEGTEISLSSFRGKVVLIDFWASWCGPCRMENPNNVRLYNKYKSKGFEIFGVSLDKDKTAWLNAIKKDQLNWVHVSDLKFWDSAAAQKYNVTGIPFTVLLDKEGKIIETGLRGTLLEAKLKEIFGE